MNRIFVYLLFVLLTSCGLSEGDKVLVVPEDSPQRTLAWSGILEKIKDDKAIINKNGKLISIPLENVFSANDEDATKVIRAREDFFNLLKKNIFTLKNGNLSESSTRLVLTEKAKKGNLNDWVAFLDLLPQIYKLNELLEQSKESTSNLINAWDDVFISFSDLEEEVHYLTNPAGSNGKGSFSDYIQDMIKLPVMEKIIGSYDAAISSAEVNLSPSDELKNFEEWKNSIKIAFELVPVRVKEAQHYALLKGKKLTEADVKTIQIKTMNKIVSDTLYTSILFASKQLKDGTSSIRLIKFLKNELGYPEKALIEFHGKKTWSELLAEAKSLDGWSRNFTSSYWRGKVMTSSYYGDDVVLVLFFKDSLLALNAELYKNNGDMLAGTVSQSSKNENMIRIKDMLGNWDWSGYIDKDGALALKGRYPSGFSVYEITTTLNTDAEIKKLEKERQVKISQLKSKLKKEKWYGVPFNKFMSIFSGPTHWFPAPVLITLDFEQDIFVMQDIGNESEKSARTVFDFNINEQGKGNLFTIHDSLENTKNWNSGDDWDITYLPSANKLLASGQGVKIEFLPENVYRKRLESLTSLANSKWSSGSISNLGASSGRWNSTLTLKQSKLLNNVVKINGVFTNGRHKVNVNYIAVPGAHQSSKQGVILSTLSMDKGTYMLSYSTAFSTDITDQHVQFRDWQKYEGYALINGEIVAGESKKLSKVKVADKPIREKTPTSHSNNKGIIPPIKRQPQLQVIKANATQEKLLKSSIQAKTQNRAEKEENDVVALLKRAKIQMSKNYLTSPPDNNAFTSYQNVLRISPHNTVAIEGINKIANKYIAWGYNAIEKKEFQKARVYLNKAKTVEPTTPSVNELKIAIKKAMAHHKASQGQQLTKDIQPVAAVQYVKIEKPVGEKKDLAVTDKKNTNQEKVTKPTVGEQFQRDLKSLGKTLGGLFQ